jgi:hypothetical protein
MRLPLLLLLLSGCAGDGQAVDAGSDLAREQADLAHAQDMATAPDLTSAPDLAKADLVAPEDLMSLPDLTVLPDFQKCIYPAMQCTVDGECCSNNRNEYLAPQAGSCHLSRCCIPGDGTGGPCNVFDSSVCCPGLHRVADGDMGFAGRCHCGA